MKYLILVLFLSVSVFANDVLIRSFYAKQNTFVAALENYTEKCGETPTLKSCWEMEDSIKKTTLTDMKTIFGSKPYEKWNDYFRINGFHSCAYSVFMITKVLKVQRIGDGKYTVVTEDDNAVYEYTFYVSSSKINEYKLEKKIMKRETDPEWD